MPTFKIKIEFQELEPVKDDVMATNYCYHESTIEAPTSNIATSMIIGALANVLSDHGKFFKIDNIYIQEI